MLGITVIFVIGAIAVDIGFWVSERRDVQAATDLAALAAASQLDPTSPTAESDAVIKGQEFAKRNGYDPANVTVTVEPDVNKGTATVTIDEKSVSFFTGIFGITSPHVGATAIGKYELSPPSPGYALFANSQDCSPGNPPLDVPGDDARVTGVAHSNGTIRIKGDDNKFFGPVNWVCSGGINDGGSGNSYPNAFSVGVQPLPINYSFGSFGCTVTFNADTTLNNVPSLWSGNDPNSKLLKDNVICSTADLTLDTDGNTGRVSLIAKGKVTINGTDNSLEPYPDLSKSQNVLAYSAFPNPAQDAIVMNVTRGIYRGYVHAPDSEAEINGWDNPQILGSVVADSIKLGGDDHIFDATGFIGPNPPPKIHLED